MKRAMGKTFSILATSLRQSRWLVAGGLAAIAGLECLALYGPQLIKQSIDLLAAGRADSGRLLSLAGAFGVLAAGVAVLRAIGRPAMLAFGRRVERDLRDTFFSRIMRLPRSFLDRLPAGDLMARSTYDIDNIRLAAGYGFQAAFNSLLTLILAFVYMLRMSPFLTVLAALPMILIPWLGRRQSVRFHRCHRDIQQSFAALTETSRDSFNAIRLIKVYDLAAVNHRHFRKAAQVHLDSNMTLARVSALYLPVMTLVTHLSQAVVWGCGGALAVLGRLTPGEIVAFCAYLFMLKTPLVYSGYLINLYQRARSSRQRLDEIFHGPAEKTDGAQVRAVQPPAAGEDILIRNLTFTYPGESRPVLKNISLKFSAGTAGAVVGPVGSGKSTLFKLLTRVYEPPGGTIFIGGRDITRMPLTTLRALMEMTAQEPFVFSGSIRENLLLACPSADGDTLWQAIDDVGLGAEIRALPHRLDTELGEKAHRLSGGQKARLALARSLLGKRRFFLLDDPLSAVDTTAEALILGNLSRLRNGCTNLVISHRPLSLSFCRNIFVLDKGRLADHGTHEELIGRSALYHRLVLAQRLMTNIKGA